ncbi:MAG: hypothetical protein ABL889_01935 [Terricaulis sp.]
MIWVMLYALIAVSLVLGVMVLADNGTRVRAVPGAPKVDPRLLQLSQQIDSERSSRKATNEVGAQRGARTVPLAVMVEDLQSKNRGEEALMTVRNVVDEAEGAAVRRLRTIAQVMTKRSPRESIEAHRNVLRLAPSDVLARRDLIEVLLSVGRFREAEAHLRRLRVQARWDGRLLLHAQCLTAEALAGVRKVDRAKQYLRDAEELLIALKLGIAESVVSYLQLARAAMVLEEIDTAERFYVAAHQDSQDVLAPNAFADTEIGLGRISLRRGDLGVARKHFENALALRDHIGDAPGVAEALEQLALVTHDREQAKALFDRAASLYGELSDVLGQARILTARAPLADAGEDLEQVSRNLSESLKILRERDLDSTRTGLRAEAAYRALSSPRLQAPEQTQA